MTEETGKTKGSGFDERIEEAERRLKEAAESAAVVEDRAIAEVRALEGNLEEERRRGTEALEELRNAHAEELERLQAAHAEEINSEREAKRKAIAAAEDRLSEIEAQTDSAERRVQEAERRAEAAEGALPDAEARARESAAAWLRGQVDSIRREAERR